MISILKHFEKHLPIEEISDVLLTRNTSELESAEELLRYFHWQHLPDIDPEPFLTYRYREDLNKRRLRDVEALITIIENTYPKIVLEIGTAEGHMTDLIASRAPNAQIHTMNIPPKEILGGSGGRQTTKAYSIEEIGRVYKENGRTNIRQILCNSLTWQPDIDNIDIAFIDGCHDADFVYRDTLKILPLMRPGGFILWHDFNPTLRKKFQWINDVCKGIAKLYRKGVLEGEILYLKNSWVGIYKVPTPKE